LRHSQTEEIAITSQYARHVFFQRSQNFWCGCSRYAVRAVCRALRSADDCQARYTLGDDQRRPVRARKCDRCEWAVAGSLLMPVGEGHFKVCRKCLCEECHSGKLWYCSRQSTGGRMGQGPVSVIHSTVEPRWSVARGAEFAVHSLSCASHDSTDWKMAAAD